MTEPSAARDVGPGALDEHLPIPSTRAAVAALIANDVVSGGLTLATLTGATFLLELLGDFGSGLAAALVAAYGLAVVRSAAHGAPRLPDTADFTGLESWLVPLAQIGLALAPSIALVMWDYALESPRLALAAMNLEPAFEWTPRRWLLAAAGLPLAAPGLLAAALTEHPLAPLHVPLNLRLVCRAPGVCSRVAFWMLLAWGLAGAVATVVGAVRGVTGAMVGVVVLRWVAMVAFSLVAFAIGWAVYRRADDFGLPRRPEHVRRHHAFAPVRGADSTPSTDGKTRLLRVRR